MIFKMAASSSSMDQGKSEQVWDFVNTELLIQEYDKYPCLYNTKIKEYITCLIFPSKIYSKHHQTLYVIVCCSVDSTDKHDQTTANTCLVVFANKYLLVQTGLYLSAPLRRV